MKEMDRNILTKEEYMKNLIKPAVNFAIGTEEFINTGNYVEEFINIDGNEYTLVVMNKDYVVVRSEHYYDLLPYKNMYFDLKSKNEKLKEELEEYKSKKRFFGIF